MLDLVPVVVTTDLDGNPRIADGRVDLGAFERLGVPLAMLISAVSQKNCNIDLLPELKSEPRQPGITDIFLTFDVPLMDGGYAVSPGGPGGPGVTIQEASCSAPAYVPYTGPLEDAFAFAAGTVLFISVPMPLTNARKYRFNLGPNITSAPDQNLEVRGLIGDVNSDGLVNATDRSVVVGAWTGPEHFSCPTDLNNDGATNGTDRSIVVGAWTGTGTNCAPLPLGAKLVRRSAAAGARPKQPIRRPGWHLPRAPKTEGNEGPGGSDDGWAMISGIFGLEVRPVGGGAPVDALVVGERYEIHYSGASHPVEAYAVLVSAPLCETSPISAVGPADATGLFEFTALDDGPASEDAPGLVRCALALDDQSGAGWLGGPAGPLCSFTAAQPGELLLEVLLSWVDEPGQTTYESQGQVSLAITD